MRTYMEDSDDPALNRLAQGYIRPIYDVGDNNQSTIFFSNVAAQTNNAIRDLYDFDQLSTEAQIDFWTIYLLSGYQYTVGRDEDPEVEFTNSVVGVADGEPDGTGIFRGQGVVVFLEANGPKECPASGNQPPLPAEYCNISSTKLHEIGHQMGADHGEGGVMDDLTTFFSNISLAIIRSRDYP